MAKAPKLVPLKPLPGSEAARYTLGEVVAVQALLTYQADEEQQRIAVKWILHNACGIGEWAFRGDVRETDLALGRQFVGQQIVGLGKLNISELRRREDGGT